uniref:Uncharacterized protein n=1 Tax=Tanacetum cinerariifolium TaxID=118510 RepID=A0A6L2L0B3_TANCI|nr:hypothetical protein [Tanacetum cinerariifolium]
MANIPRSFPLVYKDHLLDLFNQEVGKDVSRVREYMGLACGLKIVMRRKGEYIGELKALGGCEGAVETVRFTEGLQQVDMEMYNCLLLLMKEMQVKARGKAKVVWLLYVKKDVADKAKASIRIQREAKVQCCAFKLVITQRMVALPRCNELHQAARSLEREDMFILYYRKANAEDIRVGRIERTVDARVCQGERFAEEAFSSVVVPVLVLCSFTRSVFDFLAGMVDIIMRTTSSMRSCSSVPTKAIVDINKDLQLSREINALCTRLTGIVDEMERFVDELD